MKQRAEQEDGVWSPGLQELVNFSNILSMVGTPLRRQEEEGRMKVSILQAQIPLRVLSLSQGLT